MHGYVRQHQREKVRLVERELTEGDFQHFYEFYQKRATRWAFQRLHNWADAEDCMQQAMLVAYMKRNDSGQCRIFR